MLAVPHHSKVFICTNNTASDPYSWKTSREQQNEVQLLITYFEEKPEP